MKLPINKITTIIMLRLTLLLALSCLAYGKSLNISQGSSKSDVRIVGGVATTIEKHPYQVAVELYQGPWCGGSLIKPNAVLTATHCTVGKIPGYFQVRAGSAITSKGGQVALVVSICEHPKYTPQFDYDVAVLLLDRSLKLGETVQTIPLQPLNVAVPDGTLGTVTGWGYLSSGGSSPDILQEVSVPKVGDSKCQNRFPNQITSRMTCYGYDEGGKDACQGDSGGPLVANGKQVGIVSWGYGCADPLLPGFYTRIENKEIQDHINSCLTLSPIKLWISLIQQLTLKWDFVFVLATVTAFTITLYCRIRINLTCSQLFLTKQY